MPPSVTILILVLVAGLFAAIVWQAAKTEKRRRAGYAELATRRDLTHEFHPGRGRAPTEFRFIDPQTGLVLTVTRKRTTRNGSTTTSRGGSSVVTLPDPRFAGGLAVYTPPMGRGVADAASGLMGAFDTPFAKALIGKILGDDIGAHLGQLRSHPAPDGVVLTIMASVDPDPFFDTKAIQKALYASPFADRDERKAMVIVSETGVQLRVPKDLNEPDQIESLLDTATALQSTMKR